MKGANISFWTGCVISALSITAACLADTDWLQRASCQVYVKWLSGGHVGEIFIALKDLSVVYSSLKWNSWPQPHFIQTCLVPPLTVYSQADLLYGILASLLSCSPWEIQAGPSSWPCSLCSCTGPHAWVDVLLASWTSWSIFSKGLPFRFVLGPANYITNLGLRHPYHTRVSI